MNDSTSAYLESLEESRLAGMPRRIPDYPAAFSGWNAVSSYGYRGLTNSFIFIFISFLNYCNTWHERIELTHGRNLLQIVPRHFLKYGPLDLHKVVGYEDRQQRVVVCVHGHVQRDRLDLAGNIFHFLFSSLYKILLSNF